MSCRPLIHNVARLVCTLPLLAGCAIMPEPDPELAERMATIFNAVYVDVDAVHIDSVDLQRFTVEGLRGLRGLDPSIRVEIEDDTLLLELEGDTAAERGLLPDGAEPEAWAELTRTIILEARNEGTLLRNAAEEMIYEEFLDSAMLTLDRFSRYADPEDAAELKAEREGFGGIGVEIESDPDGARIVGVETDRPAAAAGLLIGDRIVAIDGTAIGGEALRQVTRMLRGSIDTAVDVTVLRDGIPDPFTVTVGRTRIVPNTVFYEAMGDSALIRVSGFNERTAKRIAEAVGQARSDLGSALSGLIIDLRGNPGGLLEQAVDSADLFLETGLISRADGRHPNSHQRFEAEPGDIADGLPVAVLINGASASAAEILAAALQDHGRAALIGMTTFGKGTIQTVIDLPNGGELYITWARFLAPSGYALHRLGVMPTICTSGVDDAVTALEIGLSDDDEQGGRALLAQRRSNDLADEDAVRTLRKLCPWRPHVSGDIDMAIAELLLGSPALIRRAAEIAKPGDV